MPVAAKAAVDPKATNATARMTFFMCVNSSEAVTTLAPSMRWGEERVKEVAKARVQEKMSK